MLAEVTHCGLELVRWCPSEAQPALLEVLHPAKLLAASEWDTLRQLGDGGCHRLWMATLEEAHWNREAVQVQECYRYSSLVVEPNPPMLGRQRATVSAFLPFLLLNLGIASQGQYLWR